MRSLLIGGVALLALASAARADVLFDFTFANPTSGQLDGEGTFSTGAASSQDTGYFLLTGLTLTELRDQTGTLDTGSLTEISFQPGSAYNPTTEAFINHASGSTFMDIGIGVASGSTTPNDFGPSAEVEGQSFSQGGVVNDLVVAGFNDIFIAANDDLLTITSQTSSVPEPSSIALLATGLLGLFGFACRRSGRS
jgi:hypothetical protein